MQNAQGAGLPQAFPNGQHQMGFDDFIEMIRESCSDEEAAENYLVYAFSMFDRQK